MFVSEFWVVNMFTSLNVEKKKKNLSISIRLSEAHPYKDSSQPVGGERHLKTVKRIMNIARR